MKYPEHEKLDKVKEQSQAIGEFLEWQREHGNFLAYYHKHVDSCMEPHGPKVDGKYCPDSLNPFQRCNHSEEEFMRRCHLSEESILPLSYQEQKLLAQYFNIDLDKLEKEKRAMLEEMRAQ